MIFRRIKSNRFSTLIKAIGLGIGYAALLLVFVFVRHEQSYDESFPDADKTFRIVRNWQKGELYGAYTPVPLLRTLMNEFPEIETGSRLWEVGAESLVNGDKVYYNEQIVAVDSSFIETFDLELVQGKRSSALTNPKTVIISEKISEKLFPDGIAIGKIILLEGDIYRQEVGKEFTITGVFRSFPETCHMRADLLISITSFPRMNRNNQPRTHHLITYLKFRNEHDEKKLEADFPKFMYDFYGKEYYEYAQSTYKLQPIKNIHTDTWVEYNEYETAKGSSESIVIFPFLALLIFLIVIINNTSLTIAESKKQRISIGVFKINGARGGYLFKNFFTEALLLNLSAILLVIISVIAFAGPFEMLMDRNLDYSILITPIALICIVAFLISSSFVQSIIPTIRNAINTPLQNLSNKDSSSMSMFSFQPVFQVVQLCICVFLLSGSLIIYRQLEFINGQIQKGVDKENIIVVRNLLQVGKKSSVLKQELLKYPEIKSASICSTVPGIANWGHWGYPVDKAEKSVHVVDYRADNDYIETLGIKIKEGRFFEKDRINDNNKIVLNETAIKQLGWEDEPIGKRYALGNTYEVIGVMEDFHFEGLQQAILPLAIRLQDVNNGIVMLVKFNSDNPEAVIRKVESLWNDFVPDREMQYSFLDSEFAFWYETERKTGQFALILSFIAILLSIMGLMAIVLNTIQNRIKEIGVRKVNGAKARQILTLLNQKFILLITIAFLIASPITWYILEKWLQHFAYRAIIGWWIFAVAGTIVLVTSLATISLQSWRAASRNPVEALRYE